MVRLLGNSSERVLIKDLGDVFYYKQIKDISDSEFELSKDLNREINKGRILILERNPAIKGDAQVVSGSSSLNASNLKQALRELLPELRSSNNDIRSAVQEIIPLLTSIVRDEVSKLSVQQIVQQNAGVSKETGNIFQDSVYIPTISSEGMVASIESKNTETSGTSANEALIALRNLNKK